MSATRQWFLRRHRLLVGVLVILGLPLGAEVAAAKECQRETPLPADVRLTPPRAEVPEPVARVAGVAVLRRTRGSPERD